MPDKQIGQLNPAPGTVDDSNTLFVVEQNGTAYKLDGASFCSALATLLDGHGGISSIAKTGTSGLNDTYTITYADNTTSTFSVHNGDGIATIVIQWGLSSATGTLPLTWYNTAPTLTATDKYLWQKMNIYYTSGTYIQVPPMIIGAYGDKGAKGNTGATGATPQLSIGSVSTLSPTQAATVTITGTTARPVLNFGIPKGNKGDAGDANLDQILAAYSVKTDRESAVLFSDGADNIPVKKLVVDMPIRQSGTGDPTPENIRPITGYNQLTLFQSGENLFDGAKWVNSSYYDASGSVVSSNNYKRDDSYIPVDPGATYYIHVTDKYTRNIHIQEYNSSKQWLRRNNIFSPSAMESYFTFTIGSDAAYLRISLGRFAYNVVLSKQIKTYAYNFADGTVYIGTLDILSGVLTYTHHGINLGSCSWTQSTTSIKFMYSSDVASLIKAPPSNSVKLDDAYCSHLTISTRDNVNSSVNNAFISAAANGNIQARYPNMATSAEQFASDVNGWFFVFPLATPQTTRLTAEEITTFLGDNAIWAGYNNVGLGVVDVEYRVEPPKIVVDNGYHELPKNPYNLGIKSEIDHHSESPPWETVLFEVVSTTHAHAKTDANLAKHAACYDHVAVSNYYPAAPWYPMEDFYTSVPSDFMISPNAEHSAFKGVPETCPNYTGTRSSIHMCSVGSYVMSDGNNQEFTIEEFVKQAVNNLQFPQAGGVTINHPNYSSLTGQDICDILDKTNGIFAMEIWHCNNNIYEFSGIPQWDAVLATGRQLYGTAVPDHRVESDTTEASIGHGYGYCHVLVRGKTEEQILQAYSHGRFYTSEYWFKNAPEDSLRFTQLRYQNDTFYVETSKSATIKFVTANGTVYESTSPETSASYSPNPYGPDSDVYIRVEATADDTGLIDGATEPVTVTNHIWSNAVMLK